MPNIAGMVSFYLKKGVSVPDFLLAHEKYNSKFVSQQKGCISRKLLVDGNKRSDLVTWETMEDAKSTFEAANGNAIAMGIMSFIDQCF